MSGRFHPRITFSFYSPLAKRSRFELEPFFSEFGYGILIKVICTLTKGHKNSQIEYDQIIEQRAIVRNNLKNCFCIDLLLDFVEGFYHNKLNQEVAVPCAAMLLHTHFFDMIQKYNLDLSDYVTEVEIQKRKIGF